VCVAGAADLGDWGAVTAIHLFFCVFFLAGAADLGDWEVVGCSE